MASQWVQQGQQPQHYQQQSQYQNTQQYQQPQYQQPQQPQQNGQYTQLPPQQYRQPPQQYSQPQPHQQQGQYVQAQQYQQAGQYPQAQPYSQTPQQYPQAQQQGYNGYQQQYPPQQYPQQPHASQQPAVPQYGAYQQPRPQQADPINGQVSAVTNSCFNCGTPNHFAQDCPEPKREVPAGALEPQKYANPLKRPKPGGTVVTKFPLTPQSSQAQGYPQGYPPTNYGQNGYTQHQGPYTPATPTSDQSSTQSPAQQQAWQQYWQWQAYHQSQQPQQSQQQSGTAYQQQLYSVPANQAAGYTNGYQQPNQASPQTSQYGQGSQMYQAQHYPPPRHTQAPPASGTPAQYNPQVTDNGTRNAAAHQRQPSDSSASIKAESNVGSPQKKKISFEEVEEDELDSLDIPDLPKGLSRDGENVHLPNTIVSPPASLISMPLPANFVVADALYPIPPPAPELEGRCQSKYLRNANSETLCENIKTSKYWKDHKDDTAFFDRPDDAKVISVDEARAQLKQHHINSEANDEINGESRSQSRSVSVKKESLDVYSSLEILERNIAEIKAQQAAQQAKLDRKRAAARDEAMSSPQSTAGGQPNYRQIFVKEEQASPPQSATFESLVKSEQDTEDVLAALGVTGTPKPVTSNPGANNGLTHDSHIASSAEMVQQPPDYLLNGPASHSPAFGYPPPPPPFRQEWLPEGTNGKSNSVGPGYANGHAFNTNGVDSGSGYYNNAADGEVLSPNDLRYEKSSSRKRSRTRRDSSSDEDEAPSRRQEDDVTPKLKRRQPQVAAAYSRRW